MNNIIQRFEIKGLFGYKDIGITFNDNIMIVIGENGFKDFAKQEKLHRNNNYKAAIDHFFQLKTYPENVVRFDVPTTIADLKERSKRLLL